MSINRTGIGIIDDCNILREGIQELIKFSDKFTISFSYPSIESWRIKYSGSVEKPKILLMDVGLPGISGLLGIDIFRKEFPEAKIIMMSGDYSTETIWGAFVRGADGYLVKPFSLNQLMSQVEIALSGGTAISEIVLNVLFENIRKTERIKNGLLDALTKREKEVVNWLSQGKSYKEISTNLFISISTVNDHLKNIYQKMNVNSKSELIAKILNAKSN